MACVFSFTLKDSKEADDVVDDEGDDKKPPSKDGTSGGIGDEKVGLTVDAFKGVDDITDVANDDVEEVIESGREGGGSTIL